MQQNADGVAIDAALKPGPLPKKSGTVLDNGSDKNQAAIAP